MFNNGKNLIVLCAAMLAAAGLNAQTPAPKAEWKQMDGAMTFFVANDLGRNGYYDQKPIAELMGVMAEEVGPECVIAAGDVHHFDGVASTSDPLWMTNFELIYSHPELMIAWHPILGNHEYRGNTQAVIDYSKVSRRWEMPGRYYTKTYEDDGVTVRLVFIDTTPLIDKYRKESDKYPEAGLQDIDKQLRWLEATLAEAKEDWVVVVGHHPICATTPKSGSERLDMQRRVDPILKRHNVAFYLCGHIHNFQHFHADGSDIDYVVNSSASLSRDLAGSPDQKFKNNDPGFAVLSAEEQSLRLFLIDKNGNIIYKVEKSKK